MSIILSTTHNSAHEVLGDQDEAEIAVAVEVARRDYPQWRAA